ncbi:MAG TPA: 4-hydroxyphenylpyruvate dioxygenase [Acidimicrobiales bacterium]|nr:4-hydroxyphenylpyruvate dioxygenase [Acidimicrobiales bacterium]
MTAVADAPTATPAALLTGWDCLELWVANARTTAQFLVSTCGFACRAYRGPETGDRARVSYVLEQGDIRLVVTAALDPADEVWDHVRTHGDGVRALSMATDDVDGAYAAAVAHGGTGLADPADDADGAGRVRRATVAGYGDTLHHFTDRRHPVWGPMFATDGLIVGDGPGPVGLEGVDHIVGNLPDGALDEWVRFYTTVFGFEELTHFDRDQISTEFSALRSTVMTNGRITMPLNEPAPGRKKSQIQEYIEAYHGPGVQHVALSTVNITTTVDRLQRRGLRFLTPPATYYADARARMVGIGDELAWEELARLGILVDREGDGYLLQVFSEPVGDRPTLFLEVIERHGATGFGEGNFKALFEAIEREQAKRGNL